MPHTRRSPMDAVAARLGWRRAHTTTAEIDDVLAEQTATAHRQAIDTARLPLRPHDSALVMQPGFLDIRGRVLADVGHLETALDGARRHGMPDNLIRRLEAAVDHGHEMTVLLADTVRATADAHTAGH
ncbi:hypothetical protein GCM10010330_67610 [Streptomyces tendae]|uniref:hypothetical protein n=1 Tax=Streptomyces tendae TaxID=1932 RepID=UPI0016766A19|nr:hypothetical protein [Streptomyces tendae]GHB03779.1 hypothetical protein GCM10010330_67610 [Streptomyces tendae]